MPVLSGHVSQARSEGRIRMKGPLPAILLATVCLCLLSTLAGATTSDTFRCPNGAIISVNDRLSTVTLRCDAPTSVSKRSVTRGFVSGYYDVVEIEEWMYDLGPSLFVYYLTFENGVLVRIESGGYGK
jgi:hypothetical protein